MCTALRLYKNITTYSYIHVHAHNAGHTENSKSPNHNQQVLFRVNIGLLADCATSSVPSSLSHLRQRTSEERQQTHSFYVPDQHEANVQIYRIQKILPTRCDTYKQKDELCDVSSSFFMKRSPNMGAKVVYDNNNVSFLSNFRMLLMNLKFKYENMQYNI